ncbi:hypothetical protein Pfo_010137, partial [Paulownia fortunei]
MGSKGQAKVRWINQQIHRDCSKKLLNLSQEAYIKRIIEHFRMHNANPHMLRTPSIMGGLSILTPDITSFERALHKDMESIVETMMQQLLSKEILHEPMKEIGERYPVCLEENKAKLGDEEYARYSHQYEHIRDLTQVYETVPENFNKIVELMQKMQECGQPPNDIVQELAPDFDLSTPGQLDVRVSTELFYYV